MRNNKGNANYVTWTVVLVLGLTCSLGQIEAAYPKFDPSTQMRLVLIPADAQVGSIIYRLRATDEEFDYPLTFELVGDTASATVRIVSLPCTKYNSVCQANVVLQRRLEIGRYYDFEVSAKDTEGEMVTQLCSITATNFTTPHDLIFPHKPGIIQIPEDAKRGTELDYVIARKNPLYQKPVYFELWGSPLFAIRQKIATAETSEGTVFLLGSLDFEKQAMYHLTILANDAYAEPGQDSRNIAELDIVVIVQDVQDQPPVFTSAAPVTRLPVGILPGDKILEVHAVDGDKGNPREIRYGLVSEGNPFTSYFEINDTSGEIFLMRSLDDIAAITNVGDPVLLTVVAEEVRVSQDEPPAMASTVQLALFLPERINSAPYFENDHYITRVDENSPQGTALVFADPYIPRVYDDDTDKSGVFYLTLINNNGTFEISPNVVERSTSFLLRVRDNILLDYEERHSVQLQILAQEIGPATNLSTTVNVTVYINDVNDNPPVFEQPVYTVELPENMTLGTKVVQVKANDVDTAGTGGLVRYTAILGYLNTSLNLDAETGVITVATNNHGFDREVMPEYHLYVEARDDNGNGNRAQVPLIIQLIDVNDETPTFDKNVYEFILSADLKSFTSMASIHATDKDATSPNNEIRYELISGNYDNEFHLDKMTGELSIQGQVSLRKRDGNMFLLTARAYDLGVPILSSTANIRIYPPESRTRTVTFVVPGANPDKAKTEEILSTITGGRVVIHNIRPLQPGEPGIPENTGKQHVDMLESSVVTATVLYDSSSIVDISQIQQRLLNTNGSYAIMNDSDIAESNTLYKAENKLLFWLLVILASLIALMVLILLLCCICSWCPLYGPASKKIINVSRDKDGVHLVHRELAKGKQAKSVQVAEWIGRREAWSAEKPSDERTKPTRWEFYNGCKEYNGYVEPHAAFSKEKSRARIHSAEEHHGVKIRASNKYSGFQNSRTNLINNSDVSIEDIAEEHELPYNDTRAATHFQHTRQNLQHEGRRHRKLNNDEEIKDMDNISIRRSDIGGIEYSTGRGNLKNNKQEIFIKDGNIEILKLMTRERTGDGIATAMGDNNNLYANVPIESAADIINPQLLMIDNSGKEILMRRFIEEQPDGKQVIREHFHIIPGAINTQSVPNEIQQQQPQQHSNFKGDTFSLGKSGPNSIVYSHTEPEVKVIHTQQVDERIPIPIPIQIQTQKQFQPTTSNQSLTHELETSLKQQNELLRKILMGKEEVESRHHGQHELILETQSLPGLSIAIGTQTDCDVGTQTDSNMKYSGSTSFRAKDKLRQRKARSENDDSISEGEYEYVRISTSNSPDGVYLLKQTNQRKANKVRSNNRHRHVIMTKEFKRNIRTPIEEEIIETVTHKGHSPPPKPVRRNIESKKVSGGGKKKQLEEKMEQTVFDKENENDDESSNQFRSDEAEENELKDEMHHHRLHSSEGVDRESDNKNSSRSSSDSESLPESKSDKSRIKENTEHSKRSKEALNNNLSAHYVAKEQKSSSLKSLNSLHSDTYETTAHEKVREYQSETGLGTRDDYQHDGKLAKNKAPRYMEWYFGGKQKTSKNFTNIPRDKNDIIEQRSTKPRKVAKPESIAIDVNSKLEPTTSSKKSSVKSSGLLKEDIKMNKKYESKKETETSHPLLQHSEYRFERGNAARVPLPPTKLPHYIYPDTPPVSSSLKDTRQNSKRGENRKSSPIRENATGADSSKTSKSVDASNTNSKAHNQNMQLNASALEDDHDSGIAMTSFLTNISRRNPIADKKSIFAIAYDDVNGVKRIASGGESTEYS